MTHTLEHSIERVQRAVARAVFASTLCAFTAGLALGLACIVLLARVALEWEPQRAVWIFVPLVIAPLVAWRVTAKKRIGPAAAAAWLDVHSGASGAVVTGFEVDDVSWSSRVAEALARVERLPTARMKRPALLCAGGLAFAVVALLVPIPRPAQSPSVALQQARIEKVLEQLATLEEELTLAPEFAEEMRASLERLKEENALENAESALEATDRASERLADEARAAAEAARSAIDGAEAAEASAGTDPDAAQKQIEEALDELSKAGLSKGLEDPLARELGLDSLDLPPGTKIDGAKLGAFSRALQGKLGDKLAKLAAKGLLKEGQFGRAGKPGEMPEFEEHVCTAECAKKPGGT